MPSDPVTFETLAREYGPKLDYTRDQVLSGTEAHHFFTLVGARLASAPSALPVVDRTTGTGTGSDASGGTTNTGDPGSVSGGLSVSGSVRHNTDFLTMRGDDGQPIYTHEYAAYSSGQRAEIRAELKERGYTHIYLYVANGGDYGRSSPYNFYENPGEFRNILQELVADGIQPVVWLAPDDSSQFHATYDPDRLAETWRSFIPQIDDLVSSYVVGLEMDEYWSSGEQDQLGRSLNELTGKPIFVHYRSGTWEGVRASWADGIVYQYGLDQSAEQIADRTRYLLSQLEPMGKALVAGEYAYRTDEEHARRLGDAAISAGAHGTGNGRHV